MRGLKRPGDKPRTTACLVASFTDAWIETDSPCSNTSPLMSHLLQMRGLKPRLQTQKAYTHRSHLLQMRGLKHRVFCRYFQRFTSHLLQMRGLKLLKIEEQNCQ